VAACTPRGRATTLLPTSRSEPDRPGNIQGDPQRFTSLINDLEAKVFGSLPDYTWVYPGHGADTTLGTERPGLPEWRVRGW